MPSRLNLLATALFLATAANADGGEYADNSSLAQLEISNRNTNEGSLAQGNSKTESPSGQKDDSDDCD